MTTKCVIHLSTGQKTAFPQLWQLSEILLDPEFPGDCNQALIDLGAVICTRSKPKYKQYPWQNVCQAYNKGMQSQLSMSNQETAQQTYQAILEALSHLIEVVAQLRSSEGGCPWDLAQTPQSLIPYVIEEAYEVIDAIKSENPDAIAEELGDLLLQVVLQAQIASDYGQFSLKEVAHGITQKLIRRHPHVFGDLEVNGVEEVRHQWEKIKAAEKSESQDQAQLLSRQLSRYARTLPPLLAGTKISQKAAAAGFEWDNVEGVWDKFCEELAEFKQALQSDSKTHQHEELGDLLFTLINLARWYGLDPSEALQGTNQRFVQRLTKMETFAQKPLSEYTLDELETLWKQAKALLGAEGQRSRGAEGQRSRGDGGDMGR